MLADVDFSTWIAGWTALGFVVVYGIVIVGSVVTRDRARQSIGFRILVTGSRGKSGVVRLVHAVVNPDTPTYAKITGTAAREVFPDGTEKETTRLGSTSSSEMPRAIRQAARMGSQVGVFECMAISPPLIRMVQRSHVRAQMVIIPAIRLDHLEEQGFSELEIARNTIEAIDGCETIISGVDQPEIQEMFRQYCRDHDIEFVHVTPDETTPACPGHHPVNVAIALEVAQRRGVKRSVAIDRLQSVSVEPGSTEFYRYRLDDGFQMDVVDISGANDPQSAWDAIGRHSSHSAAVVPILVNRWERPLRSMAFFGSFRGRYDAIGIIGTVSRWMATRHHRPDYQVGRQHQKTDYFAVTMSMAKQPERLAEVLRDRVDGLDGRVVVLLVENTHHPVADQLRHTLENKAEVLSLSEAVVGG